MTKIKNQTIFSLIYFFIIITTWGKGLALYLNKLGTPKLRNQGSILVGTDLNH